MRALTWAAACAAMLTVAACGGSGSSKTATPNPTGSPQSTQSAAAATPPAAYATITVQGTALPVTPISDAQKTAVALGRAVTFSEYKDPNGRYVVGLPDGWSISKSTTGVSAALAGAPATAQIGVFYIAGSTVARLMRADKSLQLQIGEGDMPLDATGEVQVAGITAKEIAWQGFNDGAVHQHWFIYFESHGAAWRLVLTTFPNANVDDMQAIFQRMLDSFRPLEAP